MSSTAEHVQQQLLNAIDKDQLTLPTLPEVALKVREVAEDPNVNLADLVREISNDAALSARLIKVVNSPLLRTRTEITDLSMAVSRLGMTYTANLATALAMQQMFQATSDLVDRKMREIWQRSTEVAGIAHVLCRHYTRLKPDQATLGGLVHMIGALPVLSYAEEHDLLLDDPQALDQVINAIHPIIGDRILQAWDFPAPLRPIPGQHLDFTRNSDSVDYVDIVQVALLQSLDGSNHPLTQLDWSQIPAFAKLGIDPGEEEEDLSAEMEAAMQLLN